jgi:hypothetical protein
MDIEKLAKDVEDLKRGQEEILALLRGQVQPQSEMGEFREMVRCGADPHEAFKDIQRRKKIGARCPRPGRTGE